MLACQFSIILILRICSPGFKTKLGHSASNAMAHIGGFVCPYLVAGNLSFLDLGIVFIFIHLGVALCASRLPETKGLELGKVIDSKNGNDTVGGRIEGYNLD